MHSAVSINGSSVNDGSCCHNERAGLPETAGFQYSESKFSVYEVQFRLLHRAV